jgi:hypothetical protein
MRWQDRLPPGPAAASAEAAARGRTIPAGEPADSPAPPPAADDVASPPARAARLTRALPAVAGALAVLAAIVVVLRRRG